MTIQSISSQTPPLPTTKNAAGATATAQSTAKPSADAAPVAASADTAGTTGSPSDAKQLSDAIAQVQEFTQSLAKELTFDIDDDSGRTVVKVIDSSTNEVLRQIPSEEMLGIAKALDQIQGLLIKQKA